MKWDPRRHMFAVAMIIISVVASLYFSTVLPDVVPSHFGINGAADQWSPKWQIFLLGMGVPLAVFIVLTFVPLVDPFWKRIRGKYNVFLVFRDIAIGVLVYFVIVGYVSAKEGVYESNFAGLGMGFLFVLLGNYMPKLPRNFFFGIRTPWTLASEQVWNQTHRVSGWLFVAAGIVMAGLSFSGLRQYLVILTVLTPLVLFCGFIYPFTLYRKLERVEGSDVVKL